MIRKTGLALAFAALCAAVALALWGGSERNSIAAGGRAAAQRSEAVEQPQCVRLTGFVDFNFVPTSLSDLVEHSDAVVRITPRGPEAVVSTSRSDFTTLFNMASQVDVVEVLKGDLAANSTISIFRTVASGGDLNSALEQSKCAIGAPQALVPGTSYLVGLVRAEGTGGWFRTAGPYTTVPLEPSNSGLIAGSQCVQFSGDATCDGFPFNLAGTRYEDISASTKAAAAK